jgi:hypothetical protein
MSLIERRIVSKGAFDAGRGHYYRLKLYYIWPAGNPKIDEGLLGALEVWKPKIRAETGNYQGYLIVHEGQEDLYITVCTIAGDGTVTMKSWTSPKGRIEFRSVRFSSEPAMCVWEGQVHGHAQLTFHQTVLTPGAKSTDAWLASELDLTL